MRLIRGWPDYDKVVPGNFCPINTVSLGNKPFLRLGIMNQHQIGITPSRRVEGLSGPECHAPHFNACCLPKLRQDRR